MLFTILRSANGWALLAVGCPPHKNSSQTSALLLLAKNARAAYFRTDFEPLKAGSAARKLVLKNSTATTYMVNPPHLAVGGMPAA